MVFAAGSSDKLCMGSYIIVITMKTMEETCGVLVFVVVERVGVEVKA